MNNLLVILLLQMFGVFMFLYITWRRLKEDYISNQIFNLLFTMGLIVGVSVLTSYYFLKIYMLWIFFLTFFFGNIIGSKKFGLKFIEVFEAEIFAILFYFAIAFSTFLISGDPGKILLYCSFLFLIPTFILVEKNYKNFLWYKSGKRGFTSMFTIGMFFLIRSIIALVNPSMVFLLLDYDPIVSGIISFVSFSIIFYLGK